MAGSFSSKYYHSLDAKGRIIIPMAYRDRIGQGFTIALNSGFNALAIYPAQKWEEKVQRLSKVRDTDVKGMNYVRLIMSNAQTDLELDTQGRVLLPAHLRETVGLERDITFVGMLSHVEIWDTQQYAQKDAQETTAVYDLQTYVDEMYPD